MRESAQEKVLNKEAAMKQFALGIVLGKLGHWHGRRGGELVRLERECEGAERESAAIRLFSPAATANRY